MQRLSEFYLDNYEETTNRQLSILNFFTISSMVLYLILSLILAITLNNYFKFRFDQLIQSFTFFSYIPGQYF
jgi:ABC-type sugar transport system permease subunit